MSEKFEKIDGKLLVSAYSLETMLVNAFNEGLRYGKDVAVAERQHVERLSGILSDQRVDIKSLYDDATPLRTRKTKDKDKDKTGGSSADFPPAQKQALKALEK